MKDAAGTLADPVNTPHRGMYHIAEVAEIEVSPR